VVVFTHHSPLTKRKLLFFFFVASDYDPPADARKRRPNRVATTRPKKRLPAAWDYPAPRHTGPTRHPPDVPAARSTLTRILPPASLTRNSRRIVRTPTLTHTRLSFPVG